LIVVFVSVRPTTSASRENSLLLKQFGLGCRFGPVVHESKHDDHVQHRRRDSGPEHPLEVGRRAQQKVDHDKDRAPHKAEEEEEDQLVLRQIPCYQLPRSSITGALRATVALRPWDGLPR
jgi:hypothetical protein